MHVVKHILHHSKCTHNYGIFVVYVLYPILERGTYKPGSSSDGAGSDAVVDGETHVALMYILSLYSHHI